MKYHYLLKAASLACLILITNTSITHQVHAQSVEQELARRGLTLQQAQSLAQRSGVNPNDPVALARFARQNGVPEDQIQAYLVQLRESQQNESNPGDGVTDLTGATITPSELEELGSTTAAPDVRPAPSKNGLNYFGYGLFTSVADPFKPSALGPVDDGYVVGPEDQLRLSVWGATEFQYDLEVDVEGRIFIPTIGQITVAGQSLKDLRESLKIRLSKSYSGLVKNPPTVYMDLSVTRFKPIEVFVLGEVRNAGGYTFPSNSTLFNVLYGVGGPTVNGTLRDIRIIRNGEVIANVDLYKLLLEGIDPNTIPLLSNDRIFIPPRKSEISIRGPLARPGIYELLEGEDLNKLIEFSGGLRPAVYGDRFQINRIVPLSEREDPNFAREILDFNLRNVLLGDVELNLVDGDQITLFNISNISDQFVRIRGAINRPGTYQLDSKVSNVADLIIKAENLRDDALIDRAILTRTRDDSTKIRFTIDPSKALENDPSHNLSLAKRDVVQVFSNNVQLIENESVVISGAVQNPGTYELTDDMTLEKLILLSGGFNANAYLGTIEITRTERLADDSEKTLKLDFELIEEDEEKDRFYNVEEFWTYLDRASQFTLQGRDRVFIRINPKFEGQTFIQLGGEVKFPGLYTILKENETLSEVIERAGGLTEEGYSKGARLRRNGENVVIELDRIINGDSKADVIVNPGDALFIPRVPNSVLVTGNVALDGFIKYESGQKLTYYLDQAGGLQPNSYKYLQLTQANGATYRVKRKGIFKDNPTVDDGATIRVIFEEPKEKSDKPTLKEIIGESTALLTSTLTIILLIDRL